jgi:hypothetical protein
MPLVRAWMRGLSEASGAALLVPGAIVAAMVLLALGGSFGQLGGLGQALGGPALPTATRVASPPARAALLRGVSLGTPAGVRTSAAGGVGGRFVQPPPNSGSSGGGKAHSPGGGGGGQAQPGGTRPTGCGSTCSSAAPKPTLADQVVATGTSVTSKLPAPVGQLATEVLKQVGAIVDQVLPSSARSVASALTRIKLP